MGERGRRASQGEAMIRQLDVVGPVRGASGYDRPTREFVRQFVALGVDVGLTNLEGWSPDLPPEMREAWFDELRRATEADTLLHFAMPTLVRLRPGARNVNYTMFEAERIPAAWADAARRCDLVVVPTQAAREAWTGSGIAGDRVRVAPLGVDGEFFAKARESEPLPLVTVDGRPVAQFRTRFLNVGELRPRKNQCGLLRTWLQATTPQDDAVLILKCPPVPHAVDRFVHDVHALERAAGRSLAGAAPVVLLPVLLTEDQMLGLYASATHYISMSHGEGWDQVTMDREYLEEGDAAFIDARLGPAEFHGLTGIEDQVFFDGLSWWHPDEDAAAQIVREAIAGRCAPPPPSARLAATYTWESAARTLLRALEPD
jgi:hypothetical protein